MPYSGIPSKLLEKAGASPGDVVRVERGEETFEGIVMPHHEFSAPDVLVLKLSSGYNIGIRTDERTRIKLISKSEGRVAAKVEVPYDEGKPLVAVLGTGGTIASYVEYRTGAVHPALTADDLIFSVPELSDVCNVRARVLYSIFSEDMKVKHWQHLAKEIAKELNSGAKGVIVPHGTDTLGFTAAALSFMLKNLTGPVVLVGSQRSSDRPSSDAFLNLLSAAHLCSANLGEVVVVMHGESSDTFCTVHRGTKVRKLHSSRRDAFRSVNESPLGRVHDDGRVELREDARPRAEGEVVADTRMEESVALVHFFPGLQPETLREVLAGVKGAVNAGTGLGHISADLVPVIQETVGAGKPIVMTTQCLYGRVDLDVYERGRNLLKAGVIPGEDMLPETAYVKLMWVMGHAADPKEIKTLFLKNVAGEINPAIAIEDFE